MISILLYNFFKYFINIFFYNLNDNISRAWFNYNARTIKKILTAGKQGKSLTIRISKKNLHGDNMLLLTKTQINKIMKSTSGLDLTLSPPQVKKIYKKYVELQNDHNEKTGGIL